MKIILKTAGFFHLLYYGVIISYAGIRTTFSEFWLMAGSGWLLLSALPGKCLSRMKYFLGAGIIWFLFQEYRIIQGGRRLPEPGADYLIVLGARVKGRVPSRSLMGRIRTAAEYYKQNPETEIIASGGQGPGEDITEAVCIRDTLVAMGVPEEKILLEDRSVSTRENLRYSLKFGGKDKRYVIVTNGFHLFRAMDTGKSLGMTYISGLSAPSEPILLPNYYVREFFALMFYNIMKWSGRI